ncbi:MAG: EamA family transporter [Lentisphaeria bacterium]
MAIVYALLCLLFAAVNDLVFKMYADRFRSRGAFVALVGLVWFLLTLWLPWEADSRVGATVLWGMISGTFSLTANLLLMEAMKRESAGMCSTLYRLNMIFVVAGAFLWLGESVSPMQIMGILLALLAILAFFPTGEHLFSAGSVGFYLALLAAILRAGMGLSYKYGFMHGADANGVVVINSLFWFFGGIVYAVALERRASIRNRSLLLYGVFSGLLVSGIVFFMAASLRHGDAALVLPIAQMSFIGTFMLSVVFMGESFSLRKLGAVLSGAAAVLLLSMSAA